MIHEDLISKYSLDRYSLFLLFDRIVEFLKKKGVTISYTNLEPIIESDIHDGEMYRMDRQIKIEEKHHESCMSDGLEVFLHFDIDDIGGICGRLYDILHVGCGHLWQWSADEASGLNFYGDYAWKVGSTYYLGKSEDEIKTVWDYEEEAGKIAIANLKIILAQSVFSNEFSGNVVAFFNDYMQTDLEYITSFYKTGKVVNFFEKWHYDASKLSSVPINFPLHIKQRTNKCIALINVR